MANATDAYVYAKFMHNFDYCCCYHCYYSTASNTTAFALELFSKQRFQPKLQYQ